MIRVAQRPYFIPVLKATLSTAVEPFSRKVPPGAPFLLQYVLASYRRTVVAGAQTSPELSIVLLTPGGTKFNVTPILLSHVSSPGGAFGLNAVSPINYLFMPSDAIIAEVSGQSGGLPANVSLTFMGIRGEEVIGWP